MRPDIPAERQVGLALEAGSVAGRIRLQVDILAASAAAMALGAGSVAERIRSLDDTEPVSAEPAWPAPEWEIILARATAFGVETASAMVSETDSDTDLGTDSATDLDAMAGVACMVTTASDLDDMAMASAGSGGACPSLASDTDTVIPITAMDGVV